jgi:uncharacterized protein (TIGR02145 family)
MLEGKMKYLIIFPLLFLITCNKKDKNPNEDWNPGETWIDLRDDKSYNTVQIGEQVWMAENLNFQTDTGSWNYLHNDSLGNIYGKLYNWENACKSCPEGWHLPTDGEWKELELFLGMGQKELDIIGPRGTNEGGKLKELGISHWKFPNKDGTNEYGFKALPAGLCEGEIFVFLGTFAFFWTSTEDSINRPWSRSLYYEEGDIQRYYDYDFICFSVRCIKD